MVSAFTARRISHKKEKEPEQHEIFRLSGDCGKEYERTGKIFLPVTFSILLSVILFAVFFLSIRELPVAGAAFLLDFAAAVYAIRAFKGLHPYWEMQYALKAKEDPTEMNVGCFIASLEFAGKKGLPDFMAELRKFSQKHWWF